MKKLLVCIAFVLTSVIGCASWLQQLETEPVATINSIEQDIDTVVTVATGIVQQVIPLLSSADQIKANTIWSAVLIEVGNTKTLLSDAIQVIQNSVGSNISNSAAIIAAVTQTLTDLATTVTSIEQLLSAGTASIKLSGPMTVHGHDQLSSAIKHAQASVQMISNVKSHK